MKEKKSSFQFSSHSCFVCLSFSLFQMISIKFFFSHISTNEQTKMDENKSVLQLWKTGNNVDFSLTCLPINLNRYFNNSETKKKKTVEINRSIELRTIYNLAAEHENDIIRNCTNFQDSFSYQSFKFSQKKLNKQHKSARSCSWQVLI